MKNLGAGVRWLVRLIGGADRHRLDGGANDGAEESVLREIMNRENEANDAVNMAEFSMVE